MVFSRPSRSRNPSHHIARFWRLHESLVEMPRAAAPASAPIQIPTDDRTFVIAGATAEGPHSSAEASCRGRRAADALPARPERRYRVGVQGRRSPSSRGSETTTRRNAARCTRPDHRGSSESRWTGSELTLVPAFTYILAVANQDWWWLSSWSLFLSTRDHSPGSAFATIVEPRGAVGASRFKGRASRSSEIAPVHSAWTQASGIRR